MYDALQNSRSVFPMLLCRYGISTPSNNILHGGKCNLLNCLATIYRRTRQFDSRLIKINCNILYHRQYGSYSVIYEVFYLESDRSVASCCSILDCHARPSRWSRPSRLNTCQVNWIKLWSTNHQSQSPQYPSQSQQATRSTTGFIKEWQHSKRVALFDMNSNIKK